MLYEQFYEEINAELKAIRVAEEQPKPIYIGSGEDAGILFFNFKSTHNEAGDV